MTHLARHGVEAVHEDWPATHPVASTLLAWCQKKRPALLVLGCVEMIRLKLRSDRSLSASGAFGGEVAFVGLLGFVGLSVLVLFALGQTAVMPVLLAVHLGAVLAFLLLTPFTKMAHGFYRLAALVVDAQRKSRQPLRPRKASDRSTQSTIGEIAHEKQCQVFAA